MILLSPYFFHSPLEICGAAKRRQPPWLPPPHTPRPGNGAPSPCRHRRTAPPPPPAGRRARPSPAPHPAPGSARPSPSPAGRHRARPAAGAPGRPLHSLTQPYPALPSPAAPPRVPASLFTWMAAAAERRRPRRGCGRRQPRGARSRSARPAAILAVSSEGRREQRGPAPGSRETSPRSDAAG